MKKGKKRIYLIWIVVVLLVVAAGSFFIFGDGLLDKYSYDGDAQVDGDGKASDAAEVGVTIENGVIDDGVAGAGGVSGGSDGGGTGGSVEFNCDTQEIQYSLRNFREESSCRESGVDGCIDLVMSCSMEVYNIDDIDGMFGIEYFLTDSNDKELDSVLVEKDVKSDGFKIFSADFQVTENVDENSTCPFTMKTVPRKCIQ